MPQESTGARAGAGAAAAAGAGVGRRRSGSRGRDGCLDVHLHDPPVGAGAGDRLQRKAGLLRHAPRQRAREDARAGLARRRGRRGAVAAGRRRCWRGLLRRLRARRGRGFGCRLGRCGGSSRRSGWLTAFEGRCVLALLQDQADDRVHGHALGAGRRRRSCRGCPRRSPPPPSSPCRSRSRRGYRRPERCRLRS